MNSIIQKTIERYCEMFLDFIEEHEFIGCMMLLPFWGYIVVATEQTFSPEYIADEKNPLACATRWFMLIFLGTIMEILILLMVGLVILVVLAVLTYGYLYVLPFALLFVALYFGRKLYLNSNDDKEKKDND